MFFQRFGALKTGSKPGGTKTAHTSLPKALHEGPGGVQSRKRVPAGFPKGLRRGPQRRLKSTFSRVPAHRQSPRVSKAIPGTPGSPKWSKNVPKMVEKCATSFASYALTASHRNSCQKTRGHCALTASHRNSRNSCPKNRDSCALTASHRNSCQKNRDSCALTVDHRNSS